MCPYEHAAVHDVILSLLEYFGRGKFFMGHDVENCFSQVSFKMTTLHIHRNFRNMAASPTFDDYQTCSWKIFASRLISSYQSKCAEMSLETLETFITCGKGITWSKQASDKVRSIFLLNVITVGKHNYVGPSSASSLALYWVQTSGHYPFAPSYLIGPISAADTYSSSAQYRQPILGTHFYKSSNTICHL